MGIETGDGDPERQLNGILSKASEEAQDVLRELLGPYEERGFTPEQIDRLDKLNEELKEEKSPDEVARKVYGFFKNIAQENWPVPDDLDDLLSDRD